METHLCFSQNGIFSVVTSSICWKFVKDLTLGMFLLLSPGVLPAGTRLVQWQCQGHNHSEKQRGHPQCCSLPAAWALPVMDTFIYCPFLNEHWKPHCSSPSRNAWKFTGSQRTPWLGGQGITLTEGGSFNPSTALQARGAWLLPHLQLTNCISDVKKQNCISVPAVVQFCLKFHGNVQCLAPNRLSLDQGMGSSLTWLIQEGVFCALPGASRSLTFPSASVSPLPELCLRNEAKVGVCSTESSLAKPGSPSWALFCWAFLWCIPVLAKKVNLLNNEAFKQPGFWMYLGIQCSLWVARTKCRAQYSDLPNTLKCFGAC